MLMLMRSGGSGKPGEAVSRYGYPGTVDEAGRVVLDVPDEFVDGEIESGRLAAMEKPAAKPEEAPGPPPDQPKAGEEPPADFGAMSLAEMRAYAKDRGLTIPAEITKKDDVAAFLREAAADESRE